MGGCRCSFRDCTVGTAEHPHMHFFHYPQPQLEEKLKRWLKLADKMQFLSDPPKVQRNRVICARHFRMECFLNYTMSRLLPRNLIEPTLMPLNGDYVLDYELEEKNGGPALIKTPAKPVMKHLIPPPEYEHKFTLHNNMDPIEYIHSRLIHLAETENSVPLSAITTPKQYGVKRALISNGNGEETISAKKFKILNCTITLPESSTAKANKAKKLEERTLKLSEISSETLEDCPIIFEKKNTAQANEIETESMWNSMEEESDDNNESGELQELIVEHDFTDDTTIDDMLLHNEKHEDLTNLPVQEENHTKEVNALNAQITTLEEELMECKTELQLKTSDLLTAKSKLKKVNIKYKKLENKYEELHKMHKEYLEKETTDTLTIIERLQEDNKRLQKECNKYEKEIQQQKQREKDTEEAVVKSQATSSLNAETSTISSRQQSITTALATNSCKIVQHPNSNASFSKAQLFNNVKKYVSSSMAALLRMEMFGNAEREWKPDERRVSIDLLQLGEAVYTYVSDEWRFRLPAISEARSWLAMNLVSDEEDL